MGDEAGIPGGEDGEDREQDERQSDILRVSSWTVSQSTRYGSKYDSKI